MTHGSHKKEHIKILARHDCLEWLIPLSSVSIPKLRTRWISGMIVRHKFMLHQALKTKFLAPTAN